MKNIFINGGEVLRIEDGKYYILVEDVYDVMAEVDRKEFIEELKRFSWICLTSCDKQLRQDYLDLVDYCDRVDK